MVMEERAPPTCSPNSTNKNIINALVTLSNSRVTEQVFWGFCNFFINKLTTMATIDDEGQKGPPRPITYSGYDYVLPPPY